MSFLKFEDIVNTYYISGNRMCVVFNIPDIKTYCYCDIKGGEDHRLILSAKGPFDPSLSMDRFNNPWSKFAVSEDAFLLSLKIEPSIVEKTLLDNLKIWKDNLGKIKKG